MHFRHDCLRVVDHNKHVVQQRSEASDINANELTNLAKNPLVSKRVSVANSNTREVKRALGGLDIFKLSPEQWP